MSTDRELLELAAKAVGHRIDPIDAMHEPEDWMAWNPIDDDGDALRLAVKLGVRLYGPGHAVTPDGRPCIEGEGEDELANTRREIVRAAAEIGRAMP